jgi:tripartite-type tricarboxylate transporter receptor subunit TctC
MKLPRRRFLRLAAAAAALPAASRFAWSQAYPSRPLRLIVGFAAGGNFDIVARLIGQWLSEQLNQPVIVENRPGASSNLATEAVIRERSQRDALRKAQLQFHQRRRPGRWRRSISQRHDGKRVFSGEDGS